MRIKTTTAVYQTSDTNKTTKYQQVNWPGWFIGLDSSIKLTNKNQRYVRACVCKPVGLDVIGDTFVVYNNTSATLNQVWVGVKNYYVEMEVQWERERKQSHRVVFNSRPLYTHMHRDKGMLGWWKRRNGTWKGSVNWRKQCLIIQSQSHQHACMSLLLLHKNSSFNNVSYDNTLEE